LRKRREEIGLRIGRFIVGQRTQDSTFVFAPCSVLCVYHSSAIDLQPAPLANPGAADAMVGESPRAVSRRGGSSSGRACVCNATATHAHSVLPQLECCRYRLPDAGSVCIVQPSAVVPTASWLRSTPVGLADEELLCSSRPSL